MRRSPLAALCVAATLAAAACAPPHTVLRAAAARHDDPTSRVEVGLVALEVAEDGPLRGMQIAERMRFFHTPGVSVAVIRDGKIAWARGYGVTERGGTQPVDTATLFQAASISKPVAAIAALRLVESGRLTLDDDVNGVLRGWKVPENGFTTAERVTLRRLLSHSAGLTVHGFRGYAAGEPVPSLVELLDGARPANSAPVRVDVAPGSRWRYSGGGTSVAQLLMEEATATPFPVLMRATVLEPARMTHSTFAQPLPSTHAPRAATGHRRDGSPVRGRWHTYPEMAAAGLWTTPSDLARLAIEVQRALRDEPGGLLTAATAREMLTPQSGDYGIGFALLEGGGRLFFAHGGANEGFRAHFVASADGRDGAVVMTNGDGGAELAMEILQAVGRELGWPALKPHARPPAVRRRE